MPGDTRGYSGHGEAGDVGPGGLGLGETGPEVRGGVVVSTAGENVGDLVMGGKEALNLARRLEPLHDPLSSSGWLMGVFGPVIEALVLPMLSAYIASFDHSRCPVGLLTDIASPSQPARNGTARAAPFSEVSLPL